MRRIIAASLSILLLGLLSAAGVGRTLAQNSHGTFHERTTFSGNLQGCNGEVVELEGERFTTVKIVEQLPEGRFILMFHDAVRARGVDPITGTEYVLRHTDNAVEMYTPYGPQYVVTNPINVNLISLGDTDNLHLRSRYHITITPDGQIRVMDYSVEAVCSG